MLENIRLSFQGIWAHKLRSFLTMLGIIIGIASIIAIVSTIKGTSEQIKENLVGSGNNLVEVKLSAGEWVYTSGDGNAQDVPVLTDDMMADVLAIDEVAAASKYRIGNMWEGINYQNVSLDNSSIYGVDENYFGVLGYGLVKGRLFVESDQKQFKKVVIIDSVAADALFKDESPVGHTLEIKGDAYTIVGVVEQLNPYHPTAETMSEWYTYYGSANGAKVFVPNADWPMIFSFDEPYHVVVKATSTENMTKAGKKTEDALNAYLPAKSEQEESEGQNYRYKSADLLETAKALQKVSESTSKQLIWIAGISLLVGGIGVMNIMLVSVTERTREIGLKKALGARKKVILGQFLTEAAVLTSLGGIIGVGGGIGLAYLVSKITEAPTAISGGAIAVSVLFSMIIGVVFGFIPSVKAANLNPIDALRYE
ncbi:MAG: ABC transporter permease [Lachnospiraceae bacterium]|nr:ABC transporter permease [Lachnospiraceae bacterium]